MEILIILIGLFLGGQDIQLSIIHVYGNDGTCQQDAEELRQKMGPDYQFRCEVISFTKT